MTEFVGEYGTSNGRPHHDMRGRPQSRRGVVAVSDVGRGWTGTVTLNTPIWSTVGAPSAFWSDPTAKTVGPLTALLDGLGKASWAD